MALADPPAPRSLTFEERVACQRTVEDVYWQHRTRPEANKNPKPPLSEVLPDAVLRSKVERTSGSR